MYYGKQHFRDVKGNNIAAPRDGVPRDSQDAATDTIDDQESAAIPSTTGLIIIIYLHLWLTYYIQKPNDLECMRVMTITNFVNALKEIKEYIQLISASIEMIAEALVRILMEIDMDSNVQRKEIITLGGLLPLG